MKLERNDKFKYLYPETKEIYNIPEGGIKLEPLFTYQPVKEKEMIDGGSAFIKH